MKFKYKSQGKKGEIKEGVIDAPDKFSVAKQIREQGEVPLVVELANTGGLLARIFKLSFGGKVKLREKITFTKNLSGMLQAGLSLYRALDVMLKQTNNKALKTVLTALLETINKGGTLSEGMQKYPNVFSGVFVSMVRAGEESGGLPTALTEIGGNLQKTFDLNKKIKGALMYPMIIMCAIVLIGVLMLIYVVPTLTKTFEKVGADLPSSTKLVIWISDSIKNHFILLASVVGIIVVFLITLSKLEKTKKMFDYVFLRLPVVGVMIKEVNSARTARTLSSLLSSGVDMTKALSITREVLQNHYYKQVITKAMASIEKGITLSSVFKDHSKLYPVMVGEMMEVGEETGKLSSMLIDIATFYEGEVDAKTKNMSTIIEPVLMVFIGGAVGFFAVSMISPMYSILDNIK